MLASPSKIASMRVMLTVKLCKLKKWKKKPTSISIESHAETLKWILDKVKILSG